MTPEPSLPDRLDLDSDEELEWRDLQYAQMIAMAHVWENPADDVWDTLATNDVSENSTNVSLTFPRATEPPLSD